METQHGITGDLKASYAPHYLPSPLPGYMCGLIQSGTLILTLRLTLYVYDLSNKSVFHQMMQQ